MDPELVKGKTGEAELLVLRDIGPISAGAERVAVVPGEGPGASGSPLYPTCNQAPSPTRPHVILRTWVLFTAELTIPISQMQVRTQGSHVTRVAG